MSGHAWGMVLLLAAGALLRTVFFTADAPPPVPEDGAFKTDQGWYSHNALHKIQTGRWFYEHDQNEVLHTALFSFLQYASFRIFGVRYAASKVQPLVFSLLTVVLVMLFLFRGTPAAGVVAGVLMVFNYLHVMYSRAALVEPTVVFFSTAAFIGWHLSRGRGVRWAILAGAAVFCGFWAKTHGLVMAGVLSLTATFEFAVADGRGSRIAILRRYAAFLGTLLLAYTAWRVLWLGPNARYLHSFVYYGAPRQLASSFYLRKFVVAVLLTAYFLVIRMPLAVMLAAAATAALAAGLVKGGRAFCRQRIPVCLAAVWLYAHLGFFVYYRYIRPRFLMMGFVPLVLLVAYLFADATLRNMLRTRLARALCALSGFFISGCCVFKLYADKTSEPASVIITAAAVSAVAAGMLAAVPGWLRMRRAPAVLLACYLLLQGVPYAVWAASPTYSLVENGRKIRHYLEQRGELDEYVIGPLAPTFALEGNFRTVEGQTRRLVEGMLANYRPRYRVAYHNPERHDDGNTVIRMEYRIAAGYADYLRNIKVNLLRLNGDGAVCPVGLDRDRSGG